MNKLLFVIYKLIKSIIITIQRVVIVDLLLNLFPLFGLFVQLNLDSYQLVQLVCRGFHLASDGLFEDGRCFALQKNVLDFSLQISDLFIFQSQNFSLIFI